MKSWKYMVVLWSLMVAGVISVAILEAVRPNWASWWKYNVALYLMMAAVCAVLAAIDVIQRRWAGAGYMTIVFVAALFKATSSIQPIRLGAWLVADTMFIVLMSIAFYMSWRRNKKSRQRLDELIASVQHNVERRTF